MMTITNLQDQQVDTAEQQVDDTVQQHQVNIVQGIFESVKCTATVIAQKNLETYNDEIQGRAY
jgi:hypothetical protein